MRKKWWLFLLAPPAMALFGWLFGEIVMHLWNWLMPALFGLKLITFWQAIGLLILARILVGGLGGGSNGGSPSRCKAQPSGASATAARSRPAYKAMPGNRSANGMWAGRARSTRLRGLTTVTRHSSGATAGATVSVMRTPR